MLVAVQQMQGRQGLADQPFAFGDLVPGWTQPFCLLQANRQGCSSTVRRSGANTV